MSLKDKLKAKSAGLGALVDAEMANSNKEEKSSHPRTAIGQASAFQIAVAERDEKIGQLEAKLAGGKDSMLIPINAIEPNPWQPRRVFGEEDIQKLATSIEEVGLIQPVVVRLKSVPVRDTFADKIMGSHSVPSRDTMYELVAGERRLRAHQLLDRAEIKAVVVDASNEDLALMGLAENLGREDLTDYETSKAIRRVENEFKSKKRLAEAIGVGRQDLYKFLSFNALPGFVIAELDIDPQIIGRNASEQLVAVIKANGEKAVQLLETYWPQVKAKTIDQTKLAGMIDSQIKRGETRHTDRDIKKLFIGKDQAGSITRDASALTVKIKTAALSAAKENRLREFVQTLLVEPEQ